MYWVGRWSWSACVECLSYTTGLLKGFFFSLYTNVEILFSTLLLPEMDG